MKTRFRVVALALLLPGTFACTVWRQRPVPPPATGASAPLGERAARITHASGATAVLRAPLVVGDSLVGRGAAIALADVQRLEVPRVSIARTAAGAALVVGTAVAALWAIAMGAADP